MFYDVFLELCKTINKKPGRVAEDCGLSRASVNKWKSGSTPAYETIKAVADYFNVSTDYLLGKEKEPTTVSGSGLDDKIKEISTRIAALPADKQKAVLDLLDILDQYDKADR